MNGRFGSKPQFTTKRMEKDGEAVHLADRGSAFANVAFKHQQELVVRLNSLSVPPLFL